MSSTTRRSATPISEQETQRALDELVSAMTEDHLSPSKAIAPSAVRLLVNRGVVERSNRASYVLEQLVQAGAIVRLHGSHSYRVVRKTVAVGRVPLLPASNQEAYEETIRRLSAKLQAERDQHAQQLADVRLQLNSVQAELVTANQLVATLQAENQQLTGELSKLDVPVSPSVDVQQIMSEVLSD